MYTAEYFIEKLNMIAHPEGGFYKGATRCNMKSIA